MFDGYANILLYILTSMARYNFNYFPMIGIKQKINFPQKIQMRQPNNRWLGNNLLKVEVTQSRHIRSKVDEIISNDFNQIKNHNRNILSCGIRSNNPLIFQYIRTIYDQYNITDPLRNKIIISQGHPTQLRKSIYETPIKAVEETFINTTLTGGQIDNTIQKNRNMKKSQQFNRRRPSQQFISLTPKNKQQSLQNLDISRGLKRKINDSYRYCIGCQKPIIQNNIELHQQQCQQYQNIHQMNLEGILKYVQRKIIHIQQKIKKKTQNIYSNDAQQFQISTNSLILKSDFSSNNKQQENDFMKHYNNAMQIGIRWGNASQQVNKLRWFIRIRQLLKKQFIM